MIEIKDGSKPPSKRKLTPDEARFRGSWTGGYRIVEDLAGVEETVAVLQSWRRAIYLHLEPATPTPNCPEDSATSPESSGASRAADREGRN